MRNILVLLGLFWVASANAQWDFLGDLAKDAVKDAAKEAGRSAGKELVNQVLGGGAQQGDPQAIQQIQNTQPQTVYIQNPNDANIQAELRAMREELRAMREQQMAQQVAQQKAIESSKLRAIAELSYDPFDPNSPFPATMPDLGDR